MRDKRPSTAGRIRTFRARPRLERLNDPQLRAQAVNALARMGDPKPFSEEEERRLAKAEEPRGRARTAFSLRPSISSGLGAVRPYASVILAGLAVLGIMGWRFLFVDPPAQPIKEMLATVDKPKLASDPSARWKEGETAELARDGVFKLNLSAHSSFAGTLEVRAFVRSGNASVRRWPVGEAFWRDGEYHLVIPLKDQAAYVTNGPSLLYFAYGHKGRIPDDAKVMDCIAGRRCPDPHRDPWGLLEWRLNVKLP